MAQLHPAGSGWKCVVGVAWVVLLSACGGGGSSAVPEEPIVATVGPGEFKSAALVKEFSLDAITTAVREGGDAWTLVNPKYAVTSYRLEYLTVDGKGQQVRASALVNVPNKPAGAASPVLSYQHGSMTTDADAPTNHVVASEVSVLIASKGYIVLAPDYVGYGASKGLPHPYLLAAPSASVVNDLLTAAKYWRQTRGVRDNQQLFLVGYSEGAYVSMAAARALEATANPFNQQLVLSVLGGGPYHVGVTLDELLKKVRSENALLGALINPGLLRYLGSGVQASVRNELVRQLLGPGSDVVLDATVLDNFLADDAAAIERQSNVHDWKPSRPLRLFHGKDDQLVGYRSSLVTLQAIQTRGASGLVSLTDCAAQPSSHLGCVPGFFGFMVGELQAVAKDL